MFKVPLILWNHDVSLAPCHLIGTGLIITDVYQLSRYGRGGRLCWPHQAIYLRQRMVTQKHRVDYYPASLGRRERILILTPETKQAERYPALPFAICRHLTDCCRYQCMWHSFFGEEKKTISTEKGGFQKDPGRQIGLVRCVT